MFIHLATMYLFIHCLSTFLPTYLLTSICLSVYLVCMHLGADIEVREHFIRIGSLFTLWALKLYEAQT